MSCFCDFDFEEEYGRPSEERTELPHCLVFLCASILCVDVQSHVSDIGQLESANDIDNINNSLLYPQIKAGQPSNTHGKQHKLVREYSMLCVQVTQTDLLQL